jgi:hypothetical protein
MLLFQMAACVRPVTDVWFRCEGMNACMDILAQPRQIMTIWIVAAAAWVVTQVLPIGLKLLSDYRVNSRRADLQLRREKLVAEWGLDDRLSATMRIRRGEHYLLDRRSLR